MNQFKTPIEDALSLAYETRDKIINEKYSIVGILLSCSIIASNTQKNEDTKWIICELDGYKNKETLPDYRLITIKASKFELIPKNPKKLCVLNSVEEILKRTRIMGIETICIASEEYEVDTSEYENIIKKITRRCFNFLNETIKELQYGGIIEYLMEDLRRETDKKLLQLDDRIAQEAESLRINLRSRNPTDWNKVGHSCRNILVLVANKLCPAKNEVENKTKNKHPLTEANYLNRLMAYLDEKLNSQNNKALNRNRNRTSEKKSGLH